MSSERASVHTSSALDRDKFVELLMDKHIPVDDVLDALEACVVPDPRSVVLTPQEAARLAHAARMAARWEHNNAHPEERMGGETEFYEREAQYKALAARLERFAEDEQTEFWAVYGGQGGRRIAQDLPSREAAEEVKRKFDHRLRDYMMPRTTIEQQHGRYSNA